MMSRVAAKLGSARTFYLSTLVVSENAGETYFHDVAVVNSAVAAPANGNLAMRVTLVASSPVRRATPGKGITSRLNCRGQEKRALPTLFVRQEKEV